MMQAVKLSGWRRSCAWPAVISAALASGCAGGAWLESPIQAELPIDPPKHGYPTALPPASINVPATPASSVSPQAAAAPQADSNAANADVHAAQPPAPPQQPVSARP